MLNHPQLLAAIKSGNLREAADVMTLIEGEWKKHKYLRKEGKRYVYKGGWKIPWVFSREDLKIPGNRHLLITGLAGSGKTTDADRLNNGAVRHLDDVPNRVFPSRVLKMLRRSRPQVIEGVQIPALFNSKDKLNKEARKARLSVKGTSFVQSLWRYFKRHLLQRVNGETDDRIRPIMWAKTQREFMCHINDMLVNRKGRS